MPTVSFDTNTLDRFTIDFPFHLTREEVPKALRRLVFDFLNRVIRKTPVDTGRARGGWLPYAQGKAMPPGKRIRKRDKSGKYLKSSIDNTAQGEAESGFSEHTANGIQWVEIINRVPHIIFLEYGSSGQSPQGMVRISIAELQGQNVTGKIFNEAWKKSARKAGAK